MLFSSAHYLVIRDKSEASYVCAYIANGGDREAFMKRFHKGVSTGFDPDLHLECIGLANQTTMLSSGVSRDCGNAPPRDGRPLRNGGNVGEVSLF